MNQSQKVKRESLKFTPLLAQSFSRINESVLSNLTDSGYSSSLQSTLSRSSLTPSELSSNVSHQYCSTPITSLLLSRNLKKAENKTEVSSLSIPCTPQLSADRIPLSASRTNPRNRSSVHSEEEKDNLLGSLIKQHTSLVLKRIFYYLNAEDLFRLCQVSSAYCEAVCDDSASLRRLSKYLVNQQQNRENRPVIGQRARVQATGILRQIQNTLNSSGDHAPGAVWTIPSPLEDVSSYPPLLKKLIGITKSLTDHNCVSRCHTCRCFVTVKLNHRKPVSCSKCSDPTSQRTKRKINLFR